MKNLWILLFFLTVIVACDRQKCRYYGGELQMTFIDTASHWMEGFNQATTVSASSNLGRTCSFQINTNTSSRGLGEENCRYLSGQVKSLSFKSSLYDYLFTTLVFRNLDVDEFHLGNSSYFSYYFFDYGIGITLTNNPQRRIRFEPDYTSTFDSTFTILNNFDVDGTIYNNVYKIDCFEPKYSLDEKIKVYYVDPRKGVIRFDTFNGEIWVMNY